MSLGYSFSFADETEDPGWISRNDCVRGNVFGHDTACPNDGIFADTYVTEDRRAGSDGSAPLNNGFFDLPVGLSHEFAGRIRGARISVIRKLHAVTDKDVLFNLHSFADKRVARNLAPRPDSRVFLNLNECADLGLIADFTAVQVDEPREFDAFAELDIRRDAVEFTQSVTASPRLRMDLSAASRMRTIRSPLMPSLKGFLFSIRHCRK